MIKFMIVLGVMVFQSQAVQASQTKVDRNFESVEEYKEFRSQSSGVIISDKSVEQCAGSICFITELDDLSNTARLYTDNASLEPYFGFVSSIFKYYQKFFGGDDQLKTMEIELTLVTEDEYVLRKSYVNHVYNKETQDIEPIK